MSEKPVVSENLAIINELGAMASSEADLQYIEELKQEHNSKREAAGFGPEDPALQHIDQPTGETEYHVDASGIVNLDAQPAVEAAYSNGRRG